MIAAACVSSASRNSSSCCDNDMHWGPYNYRSPELTSPLAAMIHDSRAPLSFSSAFCPAFSHHRYEPVVVCRMPFCSVACVLCSLQLPAGWSSAGVLYGKINWRVPKGDSGDFMQRAVVQTFRQQDDPAVLWNHNNAYLHYGGRLVRAAHGLPALHG